MLPYISLSCPQPAPSTSASSIASSGCSKVTPAPLVSVLVTAYNREQYIAHAIKSILASSLQDFEVVVVDDVSTDQTAAVARTFEGMDSRVRVHMNPANIGDYPNRNRAAALARGKFIKYVDSDDVIYPHGLEVMVNCMNAFPEAALGLSALPDVRQPCPLLLSPAEAYREHFFERDLLARAPGSAIIRRDAFEAVGGFSGKRQVGDHELWLALARRFPVVKMPTDLVWDRQHSAQEKNYDNEATKALMHDAVMHAALDAKDCPLDTAEKTAARNRMEKTRAKRFWKLMQSGGPQTAAEYRKAAALPAADIVAALVGGLRRL